MTSSLVDTWQNALLRDRPLGLWPLNGSGGPFQPVNDLTGWRRNGRGNDGHLRPCPSPRGNASGIYNCDAGQHNVVHAYIPYAAWMGLTKLTAEVWFRCPDVPGSPGYQGIMGRDAGGGGDRAFVIYLIAGGQLQATSNNSTGSAVYSTSTGLDDGIWHMAAWSFDNAITEQRLYVDGKLDATHVGSTAMPAAPGVDLILGGTGGGSNYDSNGATALCALFGEVLEPHRIMVHYQAAAALLA